MQSQCKQATKKKPLPQPIAPGGLDDVHRSHQCLRFAGSLPTAPAPAWHHFPRRRSPTTRECSFEWARVCTQKKASRQQDRAGLCCWRSLNFALRCKRFARFFCINTLLFTSPVHNNQPALGRGGWIWGSPLLPLGYGRVARGEEVGRAQQDDFQIGADPRKIHGAAGQKRNECAKQSGRKNAHTPTPHTHTHKYTAQNSARAAVA